MSVCTCITSLLRLYARKSLILYFMVLLLSGPQSQLLHPPSCLCSDSVICEVLCSEGWGYQPNPEAVLGGHLMSVVLGCFFRKVEDSRISSWVATMLGLLCLRRSGPPVARALEIHGSSSSLGSLANIQHLNAGGHSQGHQLWVDSSAPCHLLGASCHPMIRSGATALGHLTMKVLTVSRSWVWDGQDCQGKVVLRIWNYPPGLLLLSIANGRGCQNHAALPPLLPVRANIVGGTGYAHLPILSLA